MTDKLGREISYLRVSVTQRCNLNCVYCGSEAPDPDGLTADEIITLAAAFARCGFNKVRLTGGEPLMRADIAEIAAGIAKIDGINKLTLTTNGIKLAGYAQSLKDAGVSAVNVSVDSLDPEQYKKITGRDCLDEVLNGIKAARKAGLKVRTNSVLIRGENENAAEKLIGLAKDADIDVRFIELMPFSDKGKTRDFTVTGEELIKKFGFLTPVKDDKTEKSVAKYYEAQGFTGKIGFITPVSNNFCACCNRVRLLSDGRVRPCLGHEETYDLKPYINEPEKLCEVISAAVFNKPTGHRFLCPDGERRAMNKIGG